MSGARSAASVFGLLVALAVPFSGKAFHMDDPFFIAIAENILRHPLRPYDGAVALDDTDHRVFAVSGAVPSTFETLSHPPLVPYFIAAVGLVSGLRERPQHAAFLLFALLAAYSQYRLASRFGSRPLVATLLLVSSPIFVLAAQGLMTDMPAFALSLAALALFIEGVDSGSVRRLLLSGLLAGLAALTRYVALGLVPLGLVYVIPRRRSAAKAWLALVPIVLTFGLWCLQNRLEHGGLHLVASAQHYAHYYAGRYWGGSDLARRAVSDLAALGGTAFPLVAFFPVTAVSRTMTVFALSLAAATMIVVPNPFGLVELGGYSAREAAALVLCLAAGVFMLAETARRGHARSPDRLFLMFWLVGALAGTIALLPFGAARYMLLVLPPLVYAWSGSPRSAESPPVGLGTGLALAANVGLSLTIALADYEFADTYRSFTKQVPTYTAGRPAWFVGDWGFRHYMENAGHRYLLSGDESPAEGDVIVRPRVAGLHDMAPRVRERTELVTTVETPGSLPIRLMSAEARAGFYSHGWGLLPFAVSRSPLERFDVYRVVGGARR